MKPDPDALHRQYTLSNCSEAELALLVDFDIEGAETELSTRLAAKRLLELTAAEKQRRANKAAGMFK